MTTIRSTEKAFPQRPVLDPAIHSALYYFFDVRRGGRVVEGVPLETGCPPNRWDRGFESLPLRHSFHEELTHRVCAFWWTLMLARSSTGLCGKAFSVLLMIVMKTRLDS